MMEAVRTGAWAKSVAPLPYDREVKYLRSTGTQYIDTGVKIYSTECELSFKLSRYVNEDKYPFGFNTGTSNRLQLNIWGSNSRSAFYIVGTGGSANTTTTLGGTLNSELDFSIINNRIVMKCDGIPKYDSEISTITLSPISAYIFAQNSNGSAANNAKVDFYEFKFKDSTQSIDLIPVVKNIDGVDVGFMYDKVSRRLFGNSGTGEFTWGELDAS